MDTYTLVRPEHLNHHGYLFGGNMLKWVDEIAWLVASRDFPGCTLVTIGMNDIVFNHRVLSGSILRFHVLPLHQGKTSITYRVEVHADAPGSSVEEKDFSTQVTLVRLDDEGIKMPLPAREGYRSETG
jgi:acyl-CoA hydrolase